MKLHINTVETLLNIIKNLGGNQNNVKLYERLSNFALSVYIKKDGTPILVETERLVQEFRNIGQMEPVVSYMFMHESAINQIIKFEELYGGYANETKMNNLLTNLDFTPYDRKYSNDTVLVLTEHYISAIEGTNK
jgi:hypothetical protein